MADHDLMILPLTCPGCSAPLQATPREVVYYCRLCRCAAELCGRETRVRPMLHAGGNGDLILPFWVAPFSFQAAGVTVGTRGDFARFSGNIQREGEEADSPALLFLPAFSLQAPQVIRVGRQMTLRMPLLRGASQAPERIGEIVMAACDVEPLAEAVVVSALPEERRKSFSFMKEFRVTIGTPRLCTIPFLLRNRKCYSSELNLEF